MRFPLLRSVSEVVAKRRLCPHQPSLSSRLSSQLLQCPRGRPEAQTTPALQHRSPDGNLPIPSRVFEFARINSSTHGSRRMTCRPSAALRSQICIHRNRTIASSPQTTCSPWNMVSINSSTRQLPIKAPRSFPRQALLRVLDARDLVWLVKQRWEGKDVGCVGKGRKRKKKKRICHEMDGRHRIPCKNLRLYLDAVKAQRPCSRPLFHVLNLRILSTTS